MISRAIASVLILILIVAGPVSAQDSIAEPRDVRVGLLLTNLTEVNGAEQSISADVVMISSWSDPALADSTSGARTLPLNDVWHPTLVIYNQLTVRESMPYEVSVQPDGTVTYLQRFTGQFSTPMDLRQFPRDQQEFHVWLVSPALVATDIRLLLEDRMPTLRAEDLSISDWTVGELSLTEQTLQIAPGAAVNPGVKLTIPARRLMTYYWIQVLIPLVAIILMAYTVFWIAPTVVPTRIGVVVTTMLTLIAYRFMLANHVPRLPYLTRLDWFMLGGTVLVLLTLFTMAGTSYLVSNGQDAVVKKIDRAGRVLYPAVFVVFSLIVWL